MKITREEILHVARLAKLDHSGGVFDKMSEDMENIVSMVDKLAALDLKGETDEINTERKNAFREDVVCQKFTPEALLKTAPQQENGGIIVPKVIE